MVCTEYWIAAILALPIIYYILFKDASDAPPRLNILGPIIAGKFDFKNEGPLSVIWHGYKTVGDIFRIRLFHQNVTMLLGPAANKVFFDANDSQLSQREVYTFTIPVFGKGVVYDAQPKVMAQQLKFVSRGLTQSNMASYCTKIVQEATDFFSNWKQTGEVCLYKELSELIILTAARCLLGPEIREKVHVEFADLYQQLSDGMSHLSFFFPSAPTQAHKLRDQARARIAEIFTKSIRQRRADEANASKTYEDFLQVLIDARYMDGSMLAEHEIVGMLLAALFAGQHTSNITSTWMGLELMRNKESLLPRLMAEQEQVLRPTKGQIDLDSLAKMDLLGRCMKETLRMYPPLIVLMRKCLEPVKYKNYIIPKGDIVMTSPAVSHRLSSVYKNPEQFNPDRFAGDNPDDKEKYSFIGFGGGRHGCLGERFGFLQVKTIWSTLLRNFDFELMAPHPIVDYSAIVCGPKPPCPIRYTRKAKPIDYSD